MNSWIDVFAPLLGRIFLGGFFLWSGVQATLNFPGSVEQLAGRGLPAPVAVAITLILTEVLGGIALVVGEQVRPAALLLALYTVGAGLLLTDFSNDLSQALFLQSFAVIGGLLYLSAKEKPRR